MIKKAETKKISVFIIAALISLAGAIGITFLSYYEYGRYKEARETYQESINELENLRWKLSMFERFVPEQLMEAIFEGGKISMTYLETVNFSVSSDESKAIIFNNSGDYPLTDLETLLNSEEIEPYYKPNIACPHERGFVILQPAQATEWEQTDGTIKIKSAQNVSIMVKADKDPTGITGYFGLTE